MGLQVSSPTSNNQIFTTILFTIVEDEDYRYGYFEVIIDSEAEINSTFCTEVEIYGLIIDDEILEDDQAFILRAVDPVAFISSPSSLVITIQDNDGML